jgi:hypothetical protein
MKITWILLLCATAHLLSADEVWHVTEETLPKLRKMSMEDFGKIPTEDDLRMVDGVLRKTEYRIIHSESVFELVVQRTDVDATPIKYALKKEPSGILSGTNNGYIQPTIYLAQIDEARFLIWHGKPLNSYQIEKKK